MILSRLNFSTLAIPLILSFLALPLSAQVSDWFFEKAVNYEQTADNTAPGAPISWSVEISLDTSNPGDASSVTISSSGGSHSFEFDDGEWFFGKEYSSQAAMDAEFPSNTNYTITLSGGSLGNHSQTFTFGPADYPNVPYLTGLDFTASQSIRANAYFTLNWNNPGAVADATEFEIEDAANDSVVFSQDPEEDTISTSATIPSGVMTAGNVYKGYLFFSNRIEISGAGGFGIGGTLSDGPTLDDVIADAGLTGPDAEPTATPFNDGVDNLLKFAFNMDLTGPDSSTLTPGTGTGGLPTATPNDIFLDQRSVALPS